MPGKENNENLHPRSLNKANKARREKELGEMKWLKISAIIIGAIIIAVIIFGVFYEFVYKPNKSLAKVNNEKITVLNFQEAVRYQRSNLINNYNYMAQLYNSFGMTMDESTKNSYETQLSAEYSGFMGNQVLNSLVDQKVLDFGAKEAGFSVSDEEVNQRMESLYSYYPNGTPTVSPTDEPFVNTPTISEAQLEILRYTATPEPTEAISDISNLEEVGPSEPTVEITSAPTEVITDVSSPAVLTDDSAATSEPTVEIDPTPSAIPTEYTDDMYRQHVDDQFASNTYFSKEFFTKQLYYELLKDKVTASLTEGISTEADMVWARHILVATADEAQSVIDRYNAGEDWAVLAAELSSDTSTKDNAGDVGWFMRGSMVEAFENAAFEQEVGTISQAPVETSYGFHVIQIIAHEVRPMTSTDRENAISNAYNTWLAAAKEKLDVKIGNDWMNYVPTDPEFTPIL
ncbi:MAG: peptidylprolyl isomerase [Flexilinea sp.]